ncbi:hypothetical protein SDC9_102838 [bioreactor metagenome]|uniref:Uncharacterized protein n=1 Tax=bioreactor metagenome TaxID=1076179 RepID=A0A645ASF7_9ZZZZ
MVDRLDGLRHNAVVRRDNEDDDIRHLRTARTHGGKRLMTRRVDKRNLTVLAANGVSADMLRNAARFAFGYAAVANRVQKRGLAVVNVTHDGDNRRTGFELFRRVGFGSGAVGKHFFEGLCNAQFEFNAEVRRDQFAGVEVDLLIDRGRHAEHKELFDDLRRGFADALGEVFYRNGFRCDHRLLDHDGFGPADRLLAPALGATAARRGILVPILCAGCRFARNRFLVFCFLIVLARFYICALVGIVITDALFRTGSGSSRSCRRGTRAARCKSALTALRTRRVTALTTLRARRVSALSLRTRRVSALTALRTRRVSALTLLGTRRVSALTLLRTRCVSALSLLRTRRVAALTLLRARRISALTLLRTRRVTALTLLRTRRVAALLGCLRPARIALCNGVRFVSAGRGLLRRFRGGRLFRRFRLYRGFALFGGRGFFRRFNSDGSGIRFLCRGLFLLRSGLHGSRLSLLRLRLGRFGFLFRRFRFRLFLAGGGFLYGGFRLVVVPSAGMHG